MQNKLKIIRKLFEVLANTYYMFLCMTLIHLGTEFINFTSMFLPIHPKLQFRLISFLLNLNHITLKLIAITVLLIFVALKLYANQLNQSVRTALNFVDTNTYVFFRLEVIIALSILNLIF